MSSQKTGCNFSSSHLIRRLKSACVCACVCACVRVYVPVCAWFVHCLTSGAVRLCRSVVADHRTSLQQLVANLSDSANLGHALIAAVTLVCALISCAVCLFVHMSVCVCVRVCVCVCICVGFRRFETLTASLFAWAGTSCAFLGACVRALVAAVCAEARAMPARTWAQPPTTHRSS